VQGAEIGALLECVFSFLLSTPYFFSRGFAGVALARSKEVLIS
jgi:hypothetical protein